MSLQSSSYHLKSKHQEHGVRLLETSGIAGFVLAPANGWTTILTEDSYDEPDDTLVNASRGTLLHLACAEDFGWSFAVFEDGQELFRYQYDGEAGAATQVGELGDKPLNMLRPVDVTPDMFRKALKRILRPNASDPLLNAAVPASEFAALIGLPSLELLSFDGLLSAPPQGLKNSGVVPVNLTSAVGHLTPAVGSSQETADAPIVMGGESSGAEGTLFDQNLVGFWNPISEDSRWGKRKLTSVESRGQSYEFRPGLQIIHNHLDGSEPDKAGCQVNLETSPKQIDFYTVNQKGDKGHWYGIYEINGNELAICWAWDTEPRPQHFRIEKGGNMFLDEFRRAT